jgi:membrane dipeptidase
MLVGENLLRVWTEVERVAETMQKQGELPCEEHFEGRLWEPENMDVPRLFRAEEA